MHVETKGKWFDILSLCGIDKKYLTGRHCPCPLCGGKDRFRFDNKDGKGTYFCNQCGAGNGFTLLEKFLQKNFIEVVKKIENIIVSCKMEEIKKIDKDKVRKEYLRYIWKKSNPIKEGDSVFVYLKNRNILPESLIHSDIRCAYDIPYYEDGREKGRFDAMVSVVRDSENKIASLHVTYIKDGGKAEINNPKKLIKSVEGSFFVNLGGEINEEVSICEGIETGFGVKKLSIHRDEVPVLAMLGTTNMERFKPFNQVKIVNIYSDSDKNFAGQKSAFVLANKLSLNGIKCRVIIPNEFGDFANYNKEHGLYVTKNW